MFRVTMTTTNSGAIVWLFAICLLRLKKEKKKRY